MNVGYRVASYRTIDDVKKVASKSLQSRCDTAWNRGRPETRTGCDSCREPVHRISMFYMSECNAYHACIDSIL